MDSAAGAHRAIRRWFDAALPAVDPRGAVRRVLSLRGDILSIGGRDVSLPADGRVIVVAIGKAACGLAQGARDVLGDRIERGVVLTKHGHVTAPVEGFAVYEASHPTPDQAGLDATARILDAVQDLSDRDVVVALISGGGSALLELPRDGVTLADMQDVTSRLMHAGAGIHDLNAVRKALSQVKGGGLRQRIGDARCVTLLLSDVLGNDPTVIASGPTLVSDRREVDPMEVVRRFGLETHLPDSVLRALHEPAESTGRIDPSGDIVEVIADNALLVQELAGQARAEGMTVAVEATAWDGDASALGRQLVGHVRTLPEDIDVYVRGGEATVAVTGDGVGGRNTEMALAAAIALEGNGEWVVASLASDGDDGNSKAAGAIAAGGTVRQITDGGVDPREALRHNDSASALGVAGGLVVTGPTGTNVNDVYVAVRVRRDPLEEA